MNIGFFTDVYFPSINGVSTSVEGMMRSLEKRGHSVYIISPKYPKYLDKRKKNIRLNSIKVFDDPELRLATFAPEKKLIQVSKIDFDIIHGFAGGPVSALGLGIAKVKHIPFVMTYNTRVNKYTHYFWRGKIITPGFAKKAVRIFANRCEYVVVPSLQIKKELVSFGVRKPVAILPNGVRTDLFQKPKPGFLRKKLGINKKEKVILFVGRLGKEKSVDFLIKVLKRVLQNIPDTSLIIVGDGPEKKKLIALSERLKINNKVYFTGFIDAKDIPRVYSDADCFVFASQTETQGMVILEALASGVPVVVIKDNVFDGIVKNGVNGMVVENNQQEFAEKIKEIISNPDLQKKLSLEAIETAQKFSLESSAKKFEELYQQLISQRILKSQKTNMFKKVNKVTLAQLRRTTDAIDRFFNI